MRKRVAVITDATSSGFFFRKWHDYYGRAFGRSSLYVLTYAGLRGAFQDIELGGIWEAPHRYSDPLRCRLISSLVAALLSSHDVVVRCDVDEFLVPDPRRHAGLPDYIEQLELPYVTACGVDVIEDVADPALDCARPILGNQRRTGIRSSSLNKTSITTVPLAWAEGFHAANVMPLLDDLYLFHMKFADIKGRIAWFAHMADAVGHAGREGSYFSIDQQSMLGLQTSLLRYPRIAGWRALAEEDFDQRYLATVTRNPKNGIYVGDFMDGAVIFDIPAEFAGVV